jgi:hypothetical protein
MPRRGELEDDHPAKRVCASTAKALGLNDKDLSTLNLEHAPNPHHRSAAPMYLKTQVERLVAQKAACKAEEAERAVELRAVLEADRRAARAAEVSDAKEDVKAFKKPRQAPLVPRRGWGLPDLPQDVLEKIMVDAVRSAQSDFGMTAAACTVARLSRACPDFYTVAAAGYRAVAVANLTDMRVRVRIAGVSAETLDSMLVDPRAHKVAALRAACAGVGVHPTASLTKAQAILALLDALGLEEPLPRPGVVPSALLLHVRAERAWTSSHLLVAYARRVGVSSQGLTVAARRALGGGALPATGRELVVALCDAGVTVRALVAAAGLVDRETAAAAEARFRAAYCAAPGCNHTPGAHCTYGMCRPCCSRGELRALGRCQQHGERNIAHDIVRDRERERER